MGMAELRHLAKAVSRLREGAQNTEPIYIYGDADPDGITATVVLKEALQSVGARVVRAYFPDLGAGRESELESVVDELPDRSEENGGILVVQDTGMMSYEAVRRARGKGYEVIIIDHHDVYQELPPAFAIINPKQEKETYPFRELATVGLSYKVAEALLEDGGSEALRRGLVELTALGTIADVMPQEEDNALYIQEGTASLPETFRPGLRALWQLDDVQELAPETSSMISKLIAILGAGITTDDHSHESYELLVAGDMARARELAHTLAERYHRKQEEVAEIVSEVKSRLKEKKQLPPIIFEGDELWSKAALGSAASRLIRQYECPVFLYAIEEETCRASVRVPHNTSFDSIAALSSCHHLFLAYGGHPLASGFSAYREHMRDIEECLADAYHEQVGKQAK